VADFAPAVKRILRENGCEFARCGKGDHDIWYSPITDAMSPSITRSSRATLLMGF